MSTWPKKVKSRKKVFAKVYRPCQGRKSYRVTWYAAGQRQMRSFPKYAGPDGAKGFAEELVKELAKNSPATFLKPAQATDALAALERLSAFHQATGRRVSLLTAACEFCETASLVLGRPVSPREAIEGYLRTVASVRRVDLAVAVEEFITAEAPRARSGDGYRAQLSSKYAYNRAIMLRRFAAMLRGHAICDLSKDHLDLFIASLAGAKSKSRNRRPAASAKSRNHHRSVIRQFLAWAVRKDYLSTGHRLNEADAMRPERANTTETQFYTPRELRALLEGAEGTMRVILAIGGLAGLRTQELLRMDWADVWRVPGHIEVTAGKSKTRQRRLVEVCPALAAWLALYQACQTGRLWTGHEVTFQQHFAALCEGVKVTRKTNGLRHAFCTYHFATHANENLTAQQAGNSPAIIHAHYKGLATKKEAEAWFAVKPAKTAKNVIVLPQKATA